jgi:hypothetical protein
LYDAVYVLSGGSSSDRRRGQAIAKMERRLQHERSCQTKDDQGGVEPGYLRHRACGCGGPAEVAAIAVCDASIRHRRLD